MADGSSDMLNGWDVAFVSGLDQINQMIVQQKTSPASFEIEDGDCRMEGTFGDWQLVADPLASGGHVVVSVPVTGATLVWPSMTAGQPPTTTAIDHTFKVRVTLEFVDVPSAGSDADDSASPARQHLKVRDPNLHPTADSDAQVLFDYVHDPDTIQNAAALLEEWLDAHLDTFAHVFAASSCGMVASRADWQWLMPTAFTYAVNSDKGSFVFATLCKVNHESAAGLSQIIETAALPSGAHNSLLISERLLMQRLIAPSVTKALYLGDDDLVVLDAPVRLQNKVNVTLPPLDLGAGDSGQPLGIVTPSIAYDNITVAINADGTFSLDLYHLSFTMPDQITSVVLDASAKFALRLGDSGLVDIVPVGSMTGKATVGLTEAAIKYEIYSALAIGIIGAALSIAGPAMAAVGATAETATAVATNVAKSDASAALAAETNVDADATAELQTAAPASVPVRNLVLRVLARMGKVLLFGIGSFLVVKWPDIERFARARHEGQSIVDEVTPTLSDFAAQMLAANLWNNVTAKSPRCVSAAIVERCLVLGLKLEETA